MNIVDPFEDEAEPYAAYVNYASVMMTYEDLVLEMSHRVPGHSFGADDDDDAGIVPVTRLVSRVVMSPLEARTVGMMMLDSVEEWEERFGPLPPMPTRNIIKDDEEEDDEDAAAEAFDATGDGGSVAEVEGGSWPSGQEEAPRA